jgi:hypothetical protein
MFQFRQNQKQTTRMSAVITLKVTHKVSHQDLHQVCNQSAQHFGQNTYAKSLPWVSVTFLAARVIFHNDVG